MMKNEAAEPATYEIPAANLGRLKALIADIAKRQAKIAKRGALADYTPVGIEAGPALVRVYEENDGGKMVTRREVYHVVTVTGSAPRLAGWSFAATLQHTEEGTILRSVPGVEVDLTAYRNSKPVCEHCRVNRWRKDTYVVKHDSGEVRQVGSNCLADFTGSKSPDAAARMAELLASASDACEACGWGGGRAERVVETAEFLTMVAAASRLHGWVSRTTAREYDKTATADRAWRHLFATDSDLRKAGEERIKPEGPDAALAAETLLWAAEALERDDLNDYEHNLRVSLSSGVVTARLAGIAASAIAAYQRATGEARRKKEREEERHVNAPTGRVSFTGEIVSVKTYTSDWGVNEKMTVKVTDADGATWLAWGTVPAGLDRDKNGALVTLVGRRVWLTATLTAGRDPFFAMAKRPTGRLLEDGEPDPVPGKPKKARKPRAKKAAAPAVVVDHHHTKDDGSWWVNDAQGIPLARVCDGCQAAKLSKYRPEILSGYSQADVDEQIEAD